MESINILLKRDEVKTVRMKVIRPVFSREVIREDMPVYLPSGQYCSPQQIYELFRNLSVESKEHFICLHMDAKNRIICMDRVSVGSLNQSIVHVREVMKSVLLSSASSIVLIHNHPSGDPEPSEADKKITVQLRDALNLIDVPVLDHIVVGAKECVSMTERRLI